MPVVHHSEYLPYSPAQLYDLVRDVEAYPDFVPWCSASHVFAQNETMQKASLTIAKGPMRHTLITQNACQRHQAISMRLVSGPLRHLSGTWAFVAVEGGTQVTLDLDFAFSLPLMATLMDRFFGRAMANMVSAFAQRAKELYHDQC